jgi:single-stranded-DNA-specific exonuclease
MTPSTERLGELNQRASEACSIIRSNVEERSPVVVVNHFDADGISAGSIVLAALKRLEVPTHLRVVEGMSEKVIEEIESIESNLVIFADIGSGYLDLISKGLPNRRIIIADHHQALGTPSSALIHFNPHLLGFDGSTDISGAGTAYLLAKSFDNRNRELAPMALVGCLGDQQDKGPKRTLKGLNKTILDDAVEARLVEESQDLIFFGRQTRPIHRAIASTTSPFIPGLSNEEDKCLAILDKANIPTKEEDRWRTISDLSVDEKRRLVDVVIQHVINLGFDGEGVLQMIGAVYTLTKEDPWTPLRDAREFATLLNACGRMGKPSLGVALGVGDRGSSFEEAQEIYASYKRSLAKYMNWLAREPSALKQLGSIVVVRGDGVIDENMTGAVSSLVSASNLFGDSKVTLVVTKTREGNVKISARATDLLVERGVNLGRILQSLSPSYGGNGGGHAIAAGATIAREGVDDFLEDFRKIVSSVLS